MACPEAEGEPAGVGNAEVSVPSAQNPGGPSSSSKAEAPPLDILQMNFGIQTDEAPPLDFFKMMGIKMNEHDGDSSMAVSSSSASDDGVESLSEGDATEDPYDVRVWCHKRWETQEDLALSRIAALSQEIRDRPLLPPHPENPEKDWLDTTSGIVFPMCHCAFRGCAWVSEQLPCSERPREGFVWQGCDSRWTKSGSQREDASGCFGCCDNSQCLREHLVQCHAEVFLKILGELGCHLDLYSYYLEALCVVEQKRMPRVGCSIDRRVFKQLAQDCTEDSTRSLICLCCNCIRSSSNGNTAIAYINAFDYKGLNTQTNCKFNDL